MIAELLLPVAGIAFGVGMGAWGVAERNWVSALGWTTSAVYAASVFILKAATL